MLRFISFNPFLNIIELYCCTHKVVRGLCAPYSSKQPCPILQQPALHIFSITLLREDGAQRPPSYYG